jgi:hypothetical protein
MNSERMGSKATVPSNVVAISERAPQVSAETVSLLEQLLEEARSGTGRCQGSCRINGFSYAAFFSWISAVLFVSP